MDGEFPCNTLNVTVLLAFFAPFEKLWRWRPQKCHHFRRCCSSSMFSGPNWSRPRCLRLLPRLSVQGVDSWCSRCCRHGFGEGWWAGSSSIKLDATTEFSRLRGFRGKGLRQDCICFSEGLICYSQSQVHDQHQCKELNAKSGACENFHAAVCNHTSLHLHLNCVSALLYRGGGTAIDQMINSLRSGSYVRRALVDTLLHESIYYRQLLLLLSTNSEPSYYEFNHVNDAAFTKWRSKRSTRPHHYGNTLHCYSRILCYFKMLFRLHHTHSFGWDDAMVLLGLVYLYQL